MAGKQVDNLPKMLTMWTEYLNNDPEIRERIGKEGICSSLGEGEKELLALSIKDLSKEYLIGVKDSTFYLQEKKGKMPLITIKTPLEAFLKMASFEDRVVWFLLNDEVHFTVCEGESWNTIVTFLETFVALQELLERKPELNVA